MFKDFFQRRRTKKSIEKFVASRVSDPVAQYIASHADQIAAGAGFPDRADREIEVALVAIAAPDAASYSECAGVVADIATQHEGIVQSLLPVLIVAFGTIDAAPRVDRRGFVTSVQARFPNAAIVHGTVTASVGAFGGESHCTFGCWWPGALDALGKLAALSPGEVRGLPKQ